MLNIFVKACLIFILGVLGTTMGYADHVPTPIEKDYILRITSLNPNVPVPVYYSFLITNHSGSMESSIYQPQLTPIEIPLTKVSFINTRVYTGPKNPAIRVNILEQKGNAMEVIMEATGNVIVTNNDSSGGMYIHNH